MHIVVRDESRDIRGVDIDASVDCVSFGAVSDNSVYLPDLRVADEHFHLYRRDDKSWWLRRLPVPPDSPAAYTRLYVNALEVTEETQVKHHDEIIVARFVLTVYTDEASAQAPRAAVMADAEKIREHPLPAGTLIRTPAATDLVLPPDGARSVAEFAFEVHEARDLAVLMAVVLRCVTRMFSAHQVWLGMRRHGYGRMEFVETTSVEGRSGSDPPRLASFEYRCLERSQHICCLQAETPNVESAMCIPLMGEHAVLGMLYVDNGANSVPYGERDLDLLTILAAAVTRQFELIVREQVKLQEAISAGELSFIRELQSCMDPANVPQWDGLQLAVYCKPGLDNAGDIFDIMRLPNGLAAFMCGHVAGSPTVAALAMAEVRASFRFAGLHADPPHVLMQALSWLLHDPKKPALLSFVGIVMNPKTGAMQYATAGDIGAAVVDGRGGLRSMMQAHVPEIGSSRDYKYVSAAGRLGEGESIVLYTPGCRTITNKAGEAMGKVRLTDALGDAFGQSASAALADLLGDLRSFFQDGRQPDDITLMVLHRE